MDPKTFTDSRGKKWDTDVVYTTFMNFTANYEVNGTYYTLKFQAPSGVVAMRDIAQERALFETILTTVEFH